MARNNSRNKAEKAVEVAEPTVELSNNTFMTDEQIAQKFGYDIHTWEGTVSIWQKKNELGIK